MLYKVGSNQYRLREKSWFQQRTGELKNGTWVNVAIGVALIGGIFYCGRTATYTLISPVAHAQESGASARLQQTMLTVPTPTTPQIEMMDVWNGKYIDQFATSNNEKSLWRYQFNCVEHFESTHHYTTRNGDSGLAQGLFQYHQETWVGYRKRMMAEGLVDHIGTPYNDEEAIQTTAYIFAHGGQQNWSTYLNYCDR